MEEFKTKIMTGVIQNEYDEQLAAIKRDKDFIEAVFKDEQFVKSLNLAMLHVSGEYGNHMKTMKSAIESYLKGLGIDSKIDNETSDINAIFKLRGIFDKWYVEQVKVLSEKFKENLKKLSE